jgi:hypothetical protein
MLAALIFYDIKLKPSERVKFYKDFYGRRHKVGNKIYVTKGFMEDITYKKPDTSALIVKRGDSLKVVDFLKARKVKYQEFSVIVSSRFFR